jgi:hypothetical protein
MAGRGRGPQFAEGAEGHSLISIDEFSKVELGGQASSSEIAASDVVNGESKANDL